MVFNIFGKKKKSQTALSDEDYSVNGTSIRYKPELIQNLKDDHAKLLNIY